MSVGKAALRELSPGGQINGGQRIQGCAVTYMAGREKMLGHVEGGRSSAVLASEPLPAPDRLQDPPMMDT